LAQFNLGVYVVHDKLSVSGIFVAPLQSRILITAATHQLLVTYLHTIGYPLQEEDERGQARTEHYSGRRLQHDISLSERGKANHQLL
jgi:hypothetical protein